MSRSNSIAAIAPMRGRTPRRSFAFPAKQRGFTLLEIVAAFVVFAIAFSVLMNITGRNLAQARRASDITQAALYAQSKLDPLGVGDKIEEGHDGGRFDDRFSYDLDVRKIEPPPAQGGVIDTIPVDLLRLELTVHWDDTGKQRSARFVTLRAMQADAAAAPGTPK
jgi:general secretion pathway protein I